MISRNTDYWLCEILGWGAYTAFTLTFAVAQAGWSAGVVARYGLFWLYSIALTHGLRRIIRQRKWLELPPLRWLPRLLGGAAVVGTIQALLVVAVDAALSGSLANATALQFVLLLWLTFIGVTFLWCVLYAAIRRYRASLEMQLSLREAELRALEAQLDPHFLFNCLNSIRGMIAENPAEAQNMVTRLANILRYNLQRDRQHTMPLAREVEVVSDYLALESARFEERLRVKIEIEPGAEEVPVPTMLLQTLVENSLKHGIQPLPGGGELLVRARIRQQLLVIEVENSGHLHGSQSDGAGVGLLNARQRLRLLYGERAGLCLAGGENGRVKASVEIPVIP
ncbi:MAG: histidine kinase [Bryobacterales bacterium]